MNVLFSDKMHKAKVYVNPGRNSNLFGIDWIILLNLWEIPINTFCRKLDASEIKKLVQTEKFVMLFQQITDTMLAVLNFATAYLDDILIKSENLEEHKTHVKEVFKRIQEYGFKLGLEKCEFYMNKIKYLGQIIDHERIKPDYNKA